MTQPPSARLPGTLQQLERLLQEPKAFVPQCQGCPGGRIAQRLPLPARTQVQPHRQKTNNRPKEHHGFVALSSSYQPFTEALTSMLGSSKLHSSQARLPLTLTCSAKKPGKF